MIVNVRLFHNCIVSLHAAASFKHTHTCATSQSWHAKTDLSLQELLRNICRRLLDCVARIDCKFSLLDFSIMYTVIVTSPKVVLLYSIPAQMSFMRRVKEEGHSVSYLVIRERGQEAAAVRVREL